MALRDWLEGVATVATSATDRAAGREVSQLSQLSQGSGATKQARSVATVATVATVRQPANDSAAPEQAAELRALVARVAADWPEAERAEALAIALADPDAALVCFRALAADLDEAPAMRDDSDPHMRTCRQCANLTPGGRCLAAARGEDFGVGVIAASSRYEPDPDGPVRCGPFQPLPGDPDQRPGRERWAFLYALPRGR